MLLLLAVFAVMLTLLNLVVRKSRMQTALSEMYSLSSAARVPRFMLRDEPSDMSGVSPTGDLPGAAEADLSPSAPSPIPSRDFPRRGAWTDDMAFKQMYAVILDENGATVSQIRMFDFGLQENELTALTDKAFHSKRESGRIGSFLFVKVNKNSGTLIILRNYSDEISADRQMLVSSLLLGLAALAVLFAITFVLARKVTLPAERAFIQQKQFIADASHELKTPLSTIAINAEVLKGDIGENRWLGNIILECRQMEELVLSLLTLAKLDAGEKRPFKKESVDLSVLCSESVLSFESLAYEKGITLESEIDKSICVLGSRADLKQLINALLDNAFKYVDAQGNVCVSLTHKDPKAILSVSNSGPDIDPATLPHLFERFYRADSSRTGEKSFGLGLAIAEEIVKQHGGKISITSSGGQTVFTVVL